MFKNVKALQRGKESRICYYAKVPRTVFDGAIFAVQYLSI